MRALRVGDRCDRREEGRKDSASHGSLASLPGRTVLLCSRRSRRKEIDGLADLARARGVPDRERPRQADLRRPVPHREPDDAGEREAAGARRRDRAHARALRPRRRHGRALGAVPGRADRRVPVELNGLARQRGRERRPAPRPEQGRHAGDRRDPVHDRERVPLVELERGPVPRRGRRARRQARGRQDDLLRRRHLRLRRHGADRAPVPARPGGAADRRLVHDGADRGRARARAAREPALRAVPLRHVPGADRDAGRARRGRARRRGRAAPAGDTIEL